MTRDLRASAVRCTPQDRALEREAMTAGPESSREAGVGERAPRCCSTFHAGEVALRRAWGGSAVGEKNPQKLRGRRQAGGGRRRQEEGLEATEKERSRGVSPEVESGGDAALCLPCMRNLQPPHRFPGQPVAGPESPSPKILPPPPCTQPPPPLS
jgi:hypothetical protein